MFAALSLNIAGVRENLHEFILLNRMPFTDEFIIQSEIGKEFIADIRIAICKNCGCTQNLNNTEMEEYYSDYTYSVQSSGFAIGFMETLANRVKENYFKLIPHPSIIEIGSGTGEQLLEFKKINCQYAENHWFARQYWR